jgi:uncharacterized protein (TIGR02271 family)
MFLPAEDRYAYAEGLRRGGFVLSVRSDDTNYTRVVDILDRDGAVDLDKQEASWRGEGWTGYAGETDYPGEDEPAAASAATGRASQTDLSALSSSETAASPRMATATAGTEEVIPVYEEQLRVGKRDVSHGRVRVRSYVVETPVNEQVRLRSESVQVERKPVDRPVTAVDELFQDRVIEAEERAEEAVVAKETRVKEELTLRKTTDDRTQDIRDTVRHTEVEIQDDRGSRRSRNRHWRPNYRAHGRHCIGRRQDRHCRSSRRAGQNQARQKHCPRRPASLHPVGVGGSCRHAYPSD